MHENTALRIGATAAIASGLLVLSFGTRCVWLEVGIVAYGTCTLVWVFFRERRGKRCTR